MTWVFLAVYIGVAPAYPTPTILGQIRVHSILSERACLEMLADADKQTQHLESIEMALSCSIDKGPLNGQPEFRM